MTALQYVIRGLDPRICRWREMAGCLILIGWHQLKMIPVLWLNSSTMLVKDCPAITGLSNQG
jgi:hypothetical protein